MTLELNAEAEAIIAKVQKLLALAQGNANEHEAAAASAKAMELLAAYNLDIAMVGKSAKGKQGERKDNKSKGGLYGWQRDLWEAVAELNFCMYLSIKGLERGASYEHRVIGSKANVVSTEVMAQYLQQTVERLAKAWAKDRGYKSPFVSDAIAYREGMARRLVQRLKQLRRERLEEDARKKREREAQARHPSAAPTGNALVLADVIRSEDDYNNDYVMGWEPGTTAQNRVEAEVRRAAARARVDAMLEERKQWELLNPEQAAREKAEAAARDREYWDKIKKDEAKRERRRQQRQANGGGGGYRYRQDTPREARARTAAFDEGRQKGGEVGLDQQVDRDDRRKIGG